ncbi:hypothetical protein DPMN_055755 [Dreissena polymorpha]|uniref:G-protein coupled receptors family 1 profile domain-containing protein n=1 Tax=Dreissena polymorpha TaxID=45954 RepID=A0A9D4HQX2_DREPO|nr:hypothetical protein DPMN_055755 [Dreissena polymorpha]
MNMTNASAGMILNATTRSTSTTSETVSWTVYFSIFLIWIPGILSNLLALYFVIRDIQKAIFPAIFLLLILVCCDLSAVIFSAGRHVLERYVTIISLPFCTFISAIHIFFRVASGFINLLMAVDRVLAICLPFYYKRYITVGTWKISCLIAGFFILLYCSFPLMGLGNVISMRRGGKARCSSLGYRSVPEQRVFGMMFPLLGFVCTLTIVICNMILIRALIRMNTRVGTVGSSFEGGSSKDDPSGQSSSSASKVTPFEVVFAKLMACLALVYLVCGTPYNVSKVQKELSIRVADLFVFIITNYYITIIIQYKVNTSSLVIKQ